jgi:hypothetical protein
LYSFLGPVALETSAGTRPIVGPVLPPTRQKYRSYYRPSTTVVLGGFRAQAKVPLTLPAGTTSPSAVVPVRVAKLLQQLDFWRTIKGGSSPPNGFLALLSKFLSISLSSIVVYSQACLALNSSHDSLISLREKREEI